MLFADGALGLIVLAVWLFCVFDVITTDAALVRNLPKMAWLFIVILLFDIGAILWLVAGHPWNSGTSNLAYKGNTGRGTAPRRLNGTNPDDDEDFLRGLRERAEQQRRRAAEEPRRDEPDDGTAS